MGTPLHVTVTGAGGFLGTHVVNQLRARGDRVTALADPTVCDVCDSAQVAKAIGPCDVIVHCAAVVTIDDIVRPEVHAVNVGGTANIIDAARRLGARLVYISSVHALTEAPTGVVMREADSFDPDTVVGGYAKTKAEAAALVLAADDLKRVIIHPSGLLGPGDPGSTNLTNLVRRLMSGELGVVVDGGYDMVDVRDVAAAIVTACRTGDGCYLTTGDYVTLRQIGRIVTELVGRRRPTILPTWIARAGAIPAEWIGKVFGRPPLFTRYSLYTLGSGNRFDSTRARRELLFRPRPVRESLTDMVADLQDQTRTPSRGATRTAG
ncbi:MAG: NAD-dependent epimerase/dehydratase family protein [Corynebacterium sp.]|uniref:NAD-dependent epimerase/dehydratase family protein n=1 Tax=Corynebacterium sp. TaxID=1720 RepID=UPI0026E03B33|nr:NAD-dependent epimerase/dehydratase family protein [Corynebacterium sp.]MDO5668632.1 NAD-dependent epimerase/dehydratase family protein [Corynebacterium sp.]